MNEYPASYLCTSGPTMQGVMHFPTASMAPGYSYFTPGKQIRSYRQLTAMKLYINLCMQAGIAILITAMADDKKRIMNYNDKQLGTIMLPVLYCPAIA